VAPIPIANLYYLLAYAWSDRKPSGAAEVEGLAAETPMDLVAELLAISAERLLKRGLDRGYVPMAEDLGSPRGKLDLSATAKRGLLRSRRVRCRFTELQRDVPHNQALKAGLSTLARCDGVNHALRLRLRRASERMREVQDLRLSRQLLRRVQLHRNTAHYRFPIRLVELAWRHLIVRPGAGGTRFPDYAASPQEMGYIFERFVRGFLSREQRKYRVGASHIPWDAHSLSERASNLLPTMRSDVMLMRPGERVVIEAKCYGEPLTTHFGKHSLHSDHLYQLLAYLRSLRVAMPESAISGLLLYAGSGSRLALDYEIHGIPLRVRSLDLDQSWRGIRSDLLGLVPISREEAA
jgi:5-methylcytosine-specific restriction enzyme subunit McrC